MVIDAKSKVQRFFRLQKSRQGDQHLAEIEFNDRQNGIGWGGGPELVLQACLP